MDADDDGNTIETPRTPERIVTDWRRFACGLWRLPEGDISAAYCGDTFPRLKTFLHEGRRYMNGGNHFGGVIRIVCDCYPLIPADEYHGPDNVPYSYEGREGKFQGKTYRLGPKVIFKSSDPTIEEWTRLLRILYSDGGMFAQGVSYAEFLMERHLPTSPNESTAHTAEVELCEKTQMPETQEEMQRVLDENADVSAPVLNRQLELTL